MITKGQKLFSLNVGNSARNREQVLTPVVVTKVGRKYFWAQVPGKEYTETKYNLDDLSEVTKYFANSVIYLKKDDYLEEKHIGQICRKLYKAFDYGVNHLNISYADLLELERILEKGEWSALPDIHQWCK